MRGSNSLTSRSLGQGPLEQSFHLQLYLPPELVASLSQQLISHAVAAADCPKSDRSRIFAQPVQYVREGNRCEPAQRGEDRLVCRIDVRALNLRICSPAAAVKCLPAVRNCHCRPC